MDPSYTRLTLPAYFLPPYILIFNEFYYIKGVVVQA